MPFFSTSLRKTDPYFPGDDEREFWVRAEQRNRETAENYHRLGLANYEAMEALSDGNSETRTTKKIRFPEYF